MSDTTLATSIGESGVQVATVEHLMSALWGMAIDNVRVELSDEEVPIMDGTGFPERQTSLVSCAANQLPQ